MQKKHTLKLTLDVKAAVPQCGAAPTVHVEDVVVVGLPHGVGRHAAIGAVVGLVEVLDVQVGAGDHGVRRHVLVHPQPGDLVGTDESKDE